MAISKRVDEIIAERDERMDAIAEGSNDAKRADAIIKELDELNKQMNAIGRRRFELLGEMGRLDEAARAKYNKWSFHQALKYEDKVELYDPNTRKRIRIK